MHLVFQALSDDNVVKGRAKFFELLGRLNGESALLMNGVVGFNRDGRHCGSSQPTPPQHPNLRTIPITLSWIWTESRGL